jgi:DUF1365 family protein
MKDVGVCVAALCVLIAARLLHAAYSASCVEGTARLVLCSTSHTRLFPVRHSFSYPLLYVFFPLEDPQTNAFFAIDKWRIFHIRSADYLGKPPCGNAILQKLRWHLKRHVLLFFEI